ncbi:MAG: PDZ domain-containing protein [Planctomycetaceae bacterium]|nr:MAG: PDZ domain-containing protein [Planctomycetaceae bacterium]
MNHRRCSFFPSSLTLLLLATASIGADQDIRLQEQIAIQAAVKAVAPSVVRIDTLGGLERVGQTLVGTGPTTGLVVSKEGYVISSAFNFIQQPTTILVTLPSGDRAAAEIVGRDRARMLVLLRINTEEELTVPPVVPREEMIVGQWTIAVGRTFDSPHPNLSVGLLSARDRIWGKAIQTDAKISPNNYGGPLIDIQGRVLGVLVPLSPQGQDEVAGAEWYDSGIGFAVPLADILPHLDKLKRGEELQPGVMGINLKGADIYALPAEVAAVQPKSPARDAGLQPGDVIVQAAGEEIVRQAQLRHVIGRHYAGDQVALVVRRDDQQIELTLELADKLEPYQHPFLGVLPMRDADPEPGIVVRYVYPGSPAAEAGIQVGDRLLTLAETPVPERSAALQVLANHEPPSEIEVQGQRADQTLGWQIQLASLPTEIPDELPPAHRLTDRQQGERPPVGAIEIRLPEESNQCVAYVPETYHPTVPHGVIVWLTEPGRWDQDQLIQRYRELCRQHDLILLAPQPEDPARWQPTEVEFIRKSLDDLISNYNIDRTRIVTQGDRAGGAMAWLTALGHRDLIRGVISFDSPLPARLQVPANDPIERLAIYLAFPKNSRAAAPIRNQAERLQSMQYPVRIEELEEDAEPWSDHQTSQLIRWIDTLDRL